MNRPGRSASGESAQGPGESALAAPATAAPCPLQARCFQYSTSATPKGRTIWTTKSRGQDNQSPGTLQSSLWTSRWLCAVVRVLTIASGPGGGHRPQPARAGAPRPIPDAHNRDCSLHWVPSTRPYNTTKHSVQRGHRARGPTIASLRPCMQHPVRLADTRRRDRTRRPWAPARARHTAHVQRSGTGRRRKVVGRGRPSSKV